MNRAIVLLFVAIISLPLAANIAGFDGGDVQAENRELAAMPHLDGSLKSIAEFPNGFSRWFEDHFGFRSALVRWYGESRLFVLGVSPTTAVIAAKNGWLFYADDGGIEDYTNEQPLSSDEVRMWRETLVRAQAWLASRGVAYVFVVAPDKPVVYPEQMPDTIRRVHAESRTDQVLAALRGTSVATVDLRPELVDAKGRERIYYRTDTHWNDRGALIAYQSIVTAIRRQLGSMPPPLTRGEFDEVPEPPTGHDLAGMMGLRRVVLESDLQLVPTRARRAQVVEPAGESAAAEEGRVVTEIPGSPLPRAVVFRDSFMSAIAPNLSEHFSRAVYLWQNDFDADVIAKEHPDVVVQEIVGRHLYTYLPTPEWIPR